MRVELDEFSFEPSSVTAERGDAIEAVNVGDTGHNLTVERDGEEVAGTPTFGAGESDTLALDVAPGRYTLVCTVPGHREAGTVGELTVR